MVRIRNNKTGEIREVGDNELGKYGINMQSQSQPQIQQPVSEPKSLGGFIGNLGQDVGQNIQGLTQLPGLLMGILSGQVNLGETGKNVATGVFNEYKDLVTKPIDTIYNKPLTSFLDVLPFLAPAKSLATKAGLLKKADVVTDAGRLAKYGKAGEDFAKLPPELQKITEGAIDATKAKTFGEKLVRGGEGLRRGVAGFKAKSGTKWLDSADDFANFQKVKGFMGGPEDQLRQLAPMAEGANAAIQKILPEVTAKPRYTNIIGSFNKEAADLLDLESPAVMKAVNAEKNIVKNIIKNNPTAQAIYDYKTQLGDSLRKAKAFSGAVTNEKVMVKQAMFNGLKDTLDSLDPRIRPINTEQYRLHSYADNLLSQVEGGGMGGRLMAGGAATTIPNIIPSGPIKKLEDSLGRGLIKTGESPILKTGGNIMSKILNTTNKIPYKKSILPAVGRNINDQSPIEDTEGDINEMGQQQGMGDVQAADSTGLKEAFNQMLIKDVLTNKGKNAAQIKALAGYMGADLSTGKKLSGVAAKDLSRNQTALKDIMSMEKILYAPGGSGQIISSAIPGSLGARKYRAVWGGIVDAIGTNRTGAAYTPAQRKDYMYLLPTVGDTPSEVKFKMDRIKSEIAQYIENVTSTSAGSDGNELLQQILGQ